MFAMFAAGNTMKLSVIPTTELPQERNSKSFPRTLSAPFAVLARTNFPKHKKAKKNRVLKNTRFFFIRLFNDSSLGFCDLRVKQIRSCRVARYTENRFSVNLECGRTIKGNRDFFSDVNGNVLFILDMFTLKD